MKRLLNTPEAITHVRLSDVCSRNGAVVFSKTRVADVLPIEGSGIGTQLYSFALKAHFDFVVADGCHMPLFAVEFDGPSHADPIQATRDRKKDSLCDLLGLPILRINARYLQKRYRGLDLLTWFVEVWFAQESFCDAQRDGLVSPDEDFDAASMIRVSGYESSFPLWLGVEPRRFLKRCQAEGRCLWQVPARLIGTRTGGETVGLAFLKAADDHWIISRTGMRRQRFPTRAAELVGDLLMYEVAETLRLGRSVARISEGAVNDAVKDFEAAYEMVSFSSGY